MSDGRPRPLARRVRSSWRDRGRPAWREVRPFAFVLLALSVVVLGTIGFLDHSDRKGGEHYGFSTRSLPVGSTLWFRGATSSPRFHPRWRYARFLGVIVASYAVPTWALALFRDQLQLLRIRLFLRDHVVVCGLGTAGFAW